MLSDFDIFTINGVCDVGLRRDPSIASLWRRAESSPQECRGGRNPGFTSQVPENAPPLSRLCSMKSNQKKRDRTYVPSCTLGWAMRPLSSCRATEGQACVCACEFIGWSGGLGGSKQVGGQSSGLPILFRPGFARPVFCLHGKKEGRETHRVVELNQTEQTKQGGLRKEGRSKQQVGMQ